MWFKLNQNNVLMHSNGRGILMSMHIFSLELTNFNTENAITFDWLKLGR